MIIIVFPRIQYKSYNSYCESKDIDKHGWATKMMEIAKSYHLSSEVKKGVCGNSALLQLLADRNIQKVSSDSVIYLINTSIEIINNNGKRKKLESLFYSWLARNVCII